MLPTHSSSFRLFRLSGIQVYVHWSWFVIAFIELSYRRQYYSSPAWNVAEYLTLFAIVLMHEFGHAFACRQTGGQADEIVLWPLGGVAFVRPPARPGAELWSIAAGPLVNVVLVPVLFGVVWACRSAGLTVGNPDLRRYLNDIVFINAALLAFNILPVYPLDGGQILRSILWFFVGKGRSLQVASIIGFAGVAALVLFAIGQRSIWIGIMAFFLGQRCLEGYRYSKGLMALARLPRQTGFACPSCGEAPPSGAVWQCGSCGNRFDLFASYGVCPQCAVARPSIACVHCGTEHPLTRWDRRPTRAGESPIIDV